MQATQRRTIVDADTRRAVFMIAGARKPVDVAKVPHEKFIRNLLKDRLGWPRNEPAPEQLKQVAASMADLFVARDKKIADAKAKARAEQEAREAAANAEQAELRAKTEASAAAEG